MPQPKKTPAPAADPTPPRAWRNLYRGILLLLASGILLTLSYPTPNLWFLAPFALLPFALCIIRRPMTWRWAFVYYLFGSLWYLVNLFWLYPVTGPGTIALACFVGLYWLLFAFATHRLIVQLRWPALVVVPLAWVTTEYLLATVFSGFPWYLLGYGLAGSTTLLQTVDLFGIWTLSFLAAMTAGWLTDVLRLPLLRQHKKINPTIAILTAVYLVTLTAAIVYGIFRLSQNATTPGPTIAVIQENIPQKLKDNSKDEDKDHIFRKHYQLSTDALQAAAAQGRHIDLIAWPETMVVEPLNFEWLQISPDRLLTRAAELEEDLRAIPPAATDQIDQTKRSIASLRYSAESIRRARNYDRALTLLAQNRPTFPPALTPATTQSVTAPAPQPTHLLVGTAGYNPDTQFNQNLAILYGPDGQHFPYYAKRHLVPFGETIPFRESAPWLYNLLLNLTPYGEVANNRPGDEWTVFAFPAADGKTYRFGVPICYEDVLTYPSYSFTHPSGGQKRIDFLISITNDGWYESVMELDQHLRMSQVRAVENRVPLARSVNSGNSAIIDSCGRIRARVEHDGEPHFVSGYAILTLPIDSRISLYSRIRDIFPVLCGIVTALATGWTIVRPRRGIPDVAEPDS